MIIAIGFVSTFVAGFLVSRLLDSYRSSKRTLKAMESMISLTEGQFRAALKAKLEEESKDVSPDRVQ